MTEIALLGCDHHAVAPSRLATVTDRLSMLATSLAEARQHGRIAGALVLSTCNRFELVVEADADAAAFCHEVIAADLPWTELQGAEAVTRLLRIATGLESMVVGEAQILGQLSRAFQSAEDLGLLSRGLHMLRTRLLSSARQLRQRVPDAGPVRSVAALGVDRVEGAARIGVLGAGETSRLALEILQRRGVTATVVVNRTRSRAEALAEQFGARAMSLEEFDREPPELDALLCAVDSKEPIVGPEHVRGADTVVDLSRPSVVADDVRSAATCTVVDLDTLAVDTARLTASQQDAGAQLGVDAMARAVEIWEEIGSRRAYLGNVVEMHLESAMAEVEQAMRGKLKHLDETDQAQIRELMRRAAKRHAHYHILDLRQLSGTVDR